MRGSLALKLAVIGNAPEAWAPKPAESSPAAVEKTAVLVQETAEQVKSLEAGPEEAVKEQAT